MDDVRILGDSTGCDALIELLVATRQAERLPGVVAALSVAGRLTTIAIGHSDLAGQIPIEPTNVLRLSSMMKPLTAVAVMQLVESGRLHLDETVSRQLVSIKIDQRVTVRHLLTHSSGLTRPGYFHVDDGERIPTLREFYESGQLECSFNPGSSKEYSNHGYAVLGQLIEDITGVPFADYMRVEVFEPLGLAIDLDESTGRSKGLEFDDEVLGIALNCVPVLTPASGGWARVADIANFAAAMAAGGRGVLSKASTKALSENISPDGLPPRAFGWVRDETRYGVVLSHAGAWPGYSGNVAFCSDAGTAVAVMVNMSAEARGELGVRMIDALVPAEIWREADPVTDEHLNLTRRPAAATDTAFARSAHHDAYREVVETQFGVWDEAQQDNFFDADWNGVNFEILEWQGEPCGYVAVETRDDDVNVRELVLLPKYQNRGVGTAVLRAAIEAAQSRGVPVVLGALHANRAAFLYERLGFKEVARDDTHTLFRFDPA